MYDLLPSADETMIVDAVRRFLDSAQPLSRLRPGAPRTDRQALWRSMAGLGWFGTGLPEEAGGAGLGLVEEILIHRECGRHLVTPGLLATMLAGHLAYGAGDKGLAERFARGDARAALAVGSPGDGPAFGLDWEGSSHFVAWGEWGVGLFEATALDGAAPAECLDDSLTLAAGRFVLDRAFRLAPARSSLEARARVLLAAALVGLATGACDLAVGHARAREQFGKPIGGFQAVQHRCADMAVRQRLAWYQACLAALKVEAGAGDAELQAASALLLASEAARENGRACIQVHGGIGFQAECDAHWFVKRAFVYELAGGSERLQCAGVLAAPQPAW